MLPRHRRVDRERPLFKGSRPGQKSDMNRLNVRKALGEEAIHVETSQESQAADRAGCERLGARNTLQAIETIRRREHGLA